MCRLSRNSGYLKRLEPQGPIQACVGDIFTFLVKNRLPTAVVCDANTALWLNFLRISVRVNTFGLRVGSANFHACTSETKGFIRF